MIIWWWLGCAGPTPQLERPDVLLVSLDTTRADRLGSYGYAAAATPALDALASAGRRYRRAYSPIPLTIPAHASLMTGRYPAHLQIRGNGDAKLSPSSTTLAERLSEHGYVTAASVGAFVTTRAWGLDQGFDRYFDEIPAGRDAWLAQRPGAEVVDDLLAWEEQTRGDSAPRFAWAHLYDPHHPFVPWPEHLQAVGGRPYDAEIAYVDAQVDRLVQAFDRRDTVVLVVGDHGEGLGAHGELSHGWYVYEATQRVPWLLVGPGVSSGEVIEAPVSLVDVAPVLLELIGVPPLPAPDGSATPGGPVFMESWQLAQRFGLAPHVAVVDGPLKLVDVPRPELYDVVADPQEVENLASARPGDVQRLRALLAEAAFPEPLGDPAHPPDPELATQLAQLGYVDAGLAGAPDGPRDDPKLHQALLRRVQALDQKVPSAEADRVAIDELSALISRYPHVTELRTRLSAVLARAGRHDEAAVVVRTALARDPENVSLRVGLATLLAGEGRYVEASEIYREAAEAMPWQPRLRVMSLLALVDAGRLGEAAELGLVWSEASPGDAALAGVTGIALVKLRRFDEALPLLERGIEAVPPERGVAFHVSAARMGRGDTDGARTLLDLELEHYPGNLEALQARSGLSAQERDWAGQLLRVEAAVAVHPDDAMVLHLHAQTLYNLQRFAEARVVLDRALALYSGAATLMLLDANLMRQEGRGDAAVARFEEAKQAKAREDAARP